MLGSIEITMINCCVKTVRIPKQITKIFAPFKLDRISVGTVRTWKGLFGQLGERWDGRRTNVNSDESEFQARGRGELVSRQNAVVVIASVEIYPQDESSEQLPQ